VKKLISITAFIFISIPFVTGICFAETKKKPNSGVKPGMNEPAHLLMISGEYYSFWFVQDGKKVPVSFHTVTLKKKPFSIFIELKKTDHLQLNFNLDPYILNGFERNVPIWEIIKPVEKFMGMAEGDFNEGKEIFISDYSCHYWYYTSDQDHRFNNVTKQGDSLVCERIVENIFTIGDDEAKPVEQFDGDTIYAVFIYMTGQYDGPGKIVELQKNYVKIIFKN